jgi:formylglycine-generating enzyme required for sulfatase activity
MSRQLSVFLCHAREDRLIVEELYKALESQKWIDPWLDKERILPGQDWPAVIEQAVDEADVIIICLSNRSVMSDGYVQKEIRYAYDLALQKPEGVIFLIPLRLDDVTSIPRRLQSFQWVDYFGDQKQNEYSKLLTSLYKRYEQKIKQEESSVSPENGGIPQLMKPEKIGRSPLAERGSLERTQVIKVVNKDAQKTDPESVRKFEEKPSAKSPVRIVLIVGIVLLFILSVVGIVLYSRNQLLLTTPTATNVLIFTEVPTNVATETLVITKSPTSSPEVASSTPSIEKDGMTMIYISDGAFMLGSDQGDADEKPLQKISIGAFWVDQTEVTNKMYAMCVADGKCAPPSHVGSPSENVYYGNPKYENFPVIYVNWDMAKAYCLWAGRDLPTEFQWEKAARGTEGSIYPWGDKFDGRLLNYCDVNCPNRNKADNRYDDDNVNLAPVGYYKNGASVYGVLDMAGNVWEWVNDWYDVYPNGVPTASIYFGQRFHVIRGGSWAHNMNEARSTNRWFFSVASDALNNFTGFRCARTE